ncbi:MAG TPA: aerotolerance regulator BatC [Myxococcaceae bacterium]|nr:aerotolerance regulator BatC [Myxococcaceae bacterium]
MRRAAFGLLLLSALAALPAGAMGPFHENPPEVVEGMTALAAGKPQEALDAFDAAKARLGSRPELEHNRALALAELGQREEAAAIFRELAEDPALSRELRAKSAYNLGNVHASGSARKEAIAAYRRALTLNPGDADARHNLEVLLRNVPPKQDAPADGGQDTPDGGEPEETGQDGGQDGGSEDGESDGGEDDGGEDGGEGDRSQEEGDAQDGSEEGDGGEEGLDGGTDGGQDEGSPEDGGEEPGSSESAEGAEDAGTDGGDDQGDAGDRSERGPDAGELDGGQGDAGEDAGDDPAEGEGEDGDAGSDGGDGRPDGEPEDADAGSAGSGAGTEAPEPSEGEQEGISAQEAESMLDAMKQDERNLQLWRFQGRKRPRDGNQKDW